uniref:Uncharacterized protein n=1 Tax=Strombidium inclinatum TaxID=197538 RepID=A0A7S3IN36_9SPIT|mmetsp:Transcript_27441/g.41726  ORF Transcript_27441/g.41726 Transcript_27441/m.41726 type:complete len:165 (+) Transcript_27441:344-838(+)
MNFLVITPFCKAYCMTKKIYKQSLYRQIREGEHPCYVSVRKIVHTLMNILQLIFTLRLSYNLDSNQDSDRELVKDLERMILIQCSDDFVNSELQQTYMAYIFIDSWFIILVAMIVFNFYLDFLGLTLTYGGTWNKLNRKCHRIVTCRCRKKKRSPQKEKLLGDN